MWAYHPTLIGGPTPSLRSSPNASSSMPVTGSWSGVVHAHLRPLLLLQRVDEPNPQGEGKGEPNPPWLQPNRASPRQRRAPPVAASLSERHPLAGSTAAPIALPVPPLGAESCLRASLPPLPLPRAGRYSRPRVRPPRGRRDPARFKGGVGPAHPRI
ncbi:unnamed protein product [Urochloa humidicola]